jgi:hypothetical protein
MSGALPSSRRKSRRVRRRGLVETQYDDRKAAIYCTLVAGDTNMDSLR